MPLSLWLPRRRWRRRCLLKTWPCGDALVIRRKRLCRRNRRGRLGKILYVIKDGHQVEVGEGQAVAGKVAALGDSAIEKADLLLQRRNHAVDRLAIGLSIVGLREEVREQIGAHHGRIDPGVDQRDPLFGERRLARLGRDELWSREREIEIGGGRLGFAQLEIAMAHDGYFL